MSTVYGQPRATGRPRRGDRRARGARRPGRQRRARARRARGARRAGTPAASLRAELEILADLDAGSELAARRARGPRRLGRRRRARGAELEVLADLHAGGELARRARGPRRLGARAPSSRFSPEVGRPPYTVNLGRPRRGDRRARGPRRPGRRQRARAPSRGDRAGDPDRRVLRSRGSSRFDGAGLRHPAGIAKRVAWTPACGALLAVRPNVVGPRRQNGSCRAMARTRSLDAGFDVDLACAA